VTQNWSISEGTRKSWDRKVPYYLRIRDHFASLIEAGTLAPQSKLPPERAVGDAFGITRMTIRQALFQLEAEGLIYRLNRRGWFVSPPRLRYDPTANLSFTENALAQGRVPGVIVLSSEQVLSSAWDREHLGVTANAPVFLIRRIRSIDDRAVLVEHLHLDASRCPGLLDEPLDRSMTEILADRYGIFFGRRRIYMRPTALDQAHAQTLNVAAGTPSLYVTRAIYDQFGKVVQVDREFWRHDALDIMVDVHTDHNGVKTAAG
jgi:DNA-binding GntR family transcriptional regulator